MEGPGIFLVGSCTMVHTQSCILAMAVSVGKFARQPMGTVECQYREGLQHVEMRDNNDKMLFCSIDLTYSSTTEPMYIW